MSFNALSLAKLGIGFGALAVASIGLLSPAQVEAEQYVANSTIVSQRFRPTYALLSSDSTEVVTGTPDVFLFDAKSVSYVLTTSDRADIRSHEEAAQAHDEEPPAFTQAGPETEHILQLVKHTSLLQVNKSYTICQTTARDLWLLFKNP